MKGLEGLKVVELTSYVAGPACPRILAEMGATVYKIEPFEGDDYRNNASGFGMSKTEIDDPAFDLTSTNKTFVSINLKSEEGAKFLSKLLKEADVLVTSFRDKGLEHLGLDWETIHEKYPRLVWAQMRGYGWRGPEKDSRGFDNTAYNGRGGVFASLPQSDNFAPVNMPNGFGDFQCALALTSGILGALYRREKTGLGDKVTVNLYHVACWAQQIGLASTQFGDVWPKSRKAAATPTNNTYMAGDGTWFVLCMGSSDTYFPLIMHILGLDHLIDDERYNTLAVMNSTGTNKDVIRWMEEAFAKHDFDYWEKVFKENNVAYHKLYYFSDILEDEEAYANDILRKLPYDEFGEKALAASPIRLESVGDPILYRSRPIGYDTREVMLQYGYTDEDVDALIADGVVKCYEGEELGETALKPSYGPDSIC